MEKPISPIEPKPSDISCRELFKEYSNPTNGYGYVSPMARALGFDSEYEIGVSLNNGYRHLIHTGSVINTAKWLFENGYDIVKLKK